MKYSTKNARVILCAAHGLMLFFFLWYMNNSSYSTSVDEELLKRVFVVEDLVLPYKFNSPHNFVFVNTSKDISKIKDPNEWGDLAITDRNKLSSFFKILADNNNQHRFVVCDIFFEDPSDEDAALQHQVSRCANIIFPYHIKDDTVQKAVINVPSALGDYTTFNGKFSKFQLIYKDSLKTIPLVLHEKLDGKTDQLNYMDLRSFSPRYYIRPYQLFQSKEYPFYNLGELLMVASMDSSFYRSYLKDKFIVIGNFETDTHFTPGGKMYGPLILLNSYLSLSKGRAKLNWGWILFMVISLSFASYVLFFVKIKHERMTIYSVVDFIVHHLWNKVFCFLAICTGIVFLSEILFSIQIIISPVFFYMTYVSWILEYYTEYYKKNVL